MEIKTITSQKIWDTFVTAQGDYTFLQSFAWGEFQAGSLEKVWRLGLYDGSKLLGVCLAFTVSARRGKFLFVPHGPILSEPSSTNFKFLISKLKEVAIEERCIFLRISPWLEASSENAVVFKGLGFRPAPTYMHSEETWLLDITKSDEELLAGLRKTTRNLIHRAEREGVLIRQVGWDDPQRERDLAIQELFNLQMATVQRHGFVPFSQKTLSQELEVLGKNDASRVFLGGVGQQITSAAIIVFYGSFAFYFQSGSIPTSAPVSYLLQWEVIREAKRRNIKVYNFWGIAPEGQLNHPWTGLTTFKTGFGGFRKNYLHAQDLVLSRKYWLTFAAEKLPRRLRSLLGKMRRSG